MGLISLSVPQVGQPDTTEDPKIASNFTTLQTVINGNLDATNLAAGVLPGTLSSSIVATSQSTSSAAFTTLATPDQVTGVVLPANGLIAVWYQATWQESVASTAVAALFLGANQVKYAFPISSTSPSTQAASIVTGGAAGLPVPLATGPGGLFSLDGQSFAGAYTGDVTTGQIVGGGAGGVGALTAGQFGPCYLLAAAGTYTVSVQFKCTSGTVTASNRKLWVKVM